MRPRRERWLHTRITEELEDALKREALRLRSPVSLVVRNVLEAALDLVDDVVQSSTAPLRPVAELRQRHATREDRQPRDRGAPGNGAASRGADDGRRASALDDVYGWHEVLLNRDASCAQCAAELDAGDAAHRGLREEPGGEAIFLCSRCVRRLRSPRSADARGSERKESL